MIGTRYQVKRYAGGFDGTSDIQPDASFDTSAGYSAGYILLAMDGTTWLCDDATVGLAIWSQVVTYDESIDTALRSLTDMMPTYCHNSFARLRDSTSLSGADFTGGTLAAPGAGFTDSLFVNDTIFIGGSRRNDGPYDVTAVTDDEVELSPVVPFAYLDTWPIQVWPVHFPVGLTEIAARMAWYDVYVRAGVTPGMASESVGSYSYSKMESVGGLEYPRDLIAGLSMYKRPRVI